MCTRLPPLRLYARTSPSPAAVGRGADLAQRRGGSGKDRRKNRKKTKKGGMGVGAGWCGVGGDSCLNLGALGGSA